MADYKKCDSEYQDQLSNTGDSVAAIQEESITEFDYDDSSSFRLCRSGVLRSILRSERILPLNAEYRNSVLYRVRRLKVRTRSVVSRYVC